MYIKGLVFGLLDIAVRIENPVLAAKLRSFTITWSRFGFYDLIIENNDINKILDEAVERGYEYCLIQAYGHVIGEFWYPQHWERRDFRSALEDWIENHDFFVAGHIMSGQDDGYGLSTQCLLVNLSHYQKFDRPAFNRESSEPIQLMKPVPNTAYAYNGDLPLQLRSSDELETYTPKYPGWNFIDISLKNKKTVYSFNETINASKSSLYSDINPDIKEFTNYLDQGILNHERNGSNNHLPDNHKKFLNVIDLQTKNSRRGVFIWNLESYTDIEIPPPEFKSPLSALYSVASGFKPNRILHTHGFDNHTKVVFFDYSSNALEVKKLLHQEWDGEDYPRFLKYVFKKFPYPETFYHLWAELTPDSINWDDMYRFWQDEIDKWGSEQEIKNHWAAYRELEHVYVPCNILTEQDKLLAHIERQPNAVIWWSNAFFTVYSNWYYTLDERKQIYDEWVRRLVAKNPDIYLNGSDYNNISVNFIQAKPYLDQYSKHGNSYLDPYKLNKLEIRF